MERLPLLVSALMLATPPSDNDAPLSLFTAPVTVRVSPLPTDRLPLLLSVPAVRALPLPTPEYEYSVRLPLLVSVPTFRVSLVFWYADPSVTEPADWLVRVPVTVNPLVDNA